MRSGAKIIVDHLAAAGIRHLFMVPGESFLDVLDALHGEQRIQPIVTRNEAAAAMMAEATGKLTGRPGAAIVTRGPGAANALPGVYIAAGDGSPMLLLVGLPSRCGRPHPQFQDIDITAIFGSLAKLCVVAESARDLPALFSRALHTACEGRHGPVVIGLPEDVLAEPVETLDLTDATPPAMTAPDVRPIAHFLAEAERPLIVAGSPAWSRKAADALARCAEKYDLPVATSFRRQDRIDNRKPSYVGHLGLNPDPQLAAGLRTADLLIVLGDCLGDVTTGGYKNIDPSEPEQHVVVIAENPTQSAIRPAHALPGNPDAAAIALATLDAPRTPPPWTTWRRDLRSAYLASLHATTSQDGRGAALDEVIIELSRRLPEDAIVCNGAGNYAAFLHRFFVYKSYPSQLAPLAGSMGYGLPAAIAAKLAHPGRTVVALAGDGCFQMTGQEIATAVQYGLPIIVIVADNGMLGTIRMHQERRFPDRVVATSLINPDFANLARASGALGLKANATAAFAAALDEALAAKRPALIHIELDDRNLSPPARRTSRPRGFESWP